VIPIAIVIAVTAAFAGLFQFMAFLLCLAAAFAVPADGLLQFVFGVADSLFALPVIIVVAVQGLRGNYAGHETQNHKRRKQSSEFLEHASSSTRIGLSYPILEPGRRAAGQAKEPGSPGVAPDERW
jgi:hypothetical protein